MPTTTTKLSVTRPITSIGNTKGTDGCCGQFAIVTLRIEPIADSNDGISIEDTAATLVDQSGEVYHNDDGKLFVEGVVKGVKDVVSHYKSLGVALVGFQTIIEKLVVHQVDSTERAFRIAARNAMASCLVNRE